METYWWFKKSCTTRDVSKPCEWDRDCQPQLVRRFCQPGHGVTRRWLRAIGMWSALGPWGTGISGNAGMIWHWYTMVYSGCIEKPWKSVISRECSIKSEILWPKWFVYLIFDVCLPFFPPLYTPVRSKASGDPFAHNHRLDRWRLPVAAVDSSASLNLPGQICNKKTHQKQCFLVLKFDTQAQGLESRSW